MNNCVDLGGGGGGGGERVGTNYTLLCPNSWN